MSEERSDAAINDDHAESTPGRFIVMRLLGHRELLNPILMAGRKRKAFKTLLKRVCLTLVNPFRLED